MSELNEHQKEFEAKRAWRVLDANANRAAEGLRTIEDHARLVREDSVAAGWVKDLRHRLAAAVSKLDRAERLATRSAEFDAGTGLTPASEQRRESISDILPAATERVSQALRCLEEYSKFVSAAASLEFKRLRYEAYDVLAKTELRLVSVRLPESARLYLLLSCDRPIEGFVGYVRELAQAGVDLFQLRDKLADGASFMQYARATVAALRSTDARLIINDRIDIALASGAAGVHLGQDDLSLADARRLAGNKLWIGISTHNIQQAVEAEQAGADYIGCGPTFPSTTKSFEQLAGTDFLRQVATTISISAFAIGGIDLQNIPLVFEAGCRRVAVSGVINHADDPLANARKLKTALGRR